MYVDDVRAGNCAGVAMAAGTEWLLTLGCVDVGARVAGLAAGHGLGGGCQYRAGVFILILSCGIMMPLMNGGPPFEATSL